MDTEVDVIMERDITDADTILMNAIAEFQEQSKEFQIARFELGHEEDGQPAIRAALEFVLKNRIRIRFPCFVTTSSVEDNLSILKKVVADARKDGA